MNTPIEKDYIDAKLQAVIERLDQGHDWIRVMDQGQVRQLDTS